jgi:hypothetical protein
MQDEQTLERGSPREVSESGNDTFYQHIKQETTSNTFNLDGQLLSSPIAQSPRLVDQLADSSDAEDAEDLEDAENVDELSDGDVSMDCASPSLLNRILSDESRTAILPRNPH